MRSNRFFRPHILIGASWITFIKIIYETGFKITVEGISRLLTSSFIILMLTPFRIIERIIYFTSPKPEVKSPIFIIGHPRSGTTFVHDSLNELDETATPRMIDCLFPYMNKYFEFLLVPILKKALPENRLMDKMKVSWDSPQEEEFAMVLMSAFSSVKFLFAPLNHRIITEKLVLMKEKVEKRKWLKTHYAFAQKLQSMNPGKTLVFKSPGNTARVNELLEIYPDANFIHIVRNPKDVIPSTLHLYKSILPEFSLQRYQELNLERYVFNYYGQVMSKYLNSKDKIGTNQLYELKYEEFVADPINELNKTFAQLNIPFEGGKLYSFFEARTNYSKNKFELDQPLEDQIKEKCEKVFKFYSYN